MLGTSYTWVDCLSCFLPMAAPLWAPPKWLFLTSTLRESPHQPPRKSFFLPLVSNVLSTSNNSDLWRFSPVHLVTDDCITSGLISKWLVPLVSTSNGGGSGWLGWMLATLTTLCLHWCRTSRHVWSGQEVCPNLGTTSFKGPGQSKQARSFEGDSWGC